jgi:serine/threonine-protein kinase
MLGRLFMGRYETVRLLGEGGMGRVYLARQRDLGRQVVVKVMHDHIAADPKFCERFVRETLLMARLVHPYAVTLYDASLNDLQGPCIVMEYIRGITLDTLLQNNGRLTPARVGRLLYQLCEVLQAAHVLGIVHRDLKPANIMIVDPDTPYELLKVMDFGLAKLVAPDQIPAVTVTNAEFAVGTPGYMCPEQARGEDLDHRADLYSVGVILFELLTGRLPFAGASTMDMLLAQVTQPAPSFSDVLPDHGISPAVEIVVQQCLAKDPADRPRNARELAELYERALNCDLELPDEPLPVEPEPLPPTANTIRPLAPTSHAPPATVVLPSVNADTDPLAVVHHIEAWMPERIATYKLRGFIQDVGGEIVENSPGRIHVRIGGRGSVYILPTRSFSWLGIGRKSNLIDMELRLEHVEGQRDSQLHITVTFRMPGQNLNADTNWRKLCNQIFCDLRGYLMGQSGPVGTGV